MTILSRLNPDKRRSALTILRQIASMPDHTLKQMEGVAVLASGKKGGGR